MIPFASGARVWIALRQTDMRRGMDALARQVQHGLQHDPHAGDLYIFRGRRGDLIKILWVDDVGLSLYIKRLERGWFIWPSAKDGVIAISASQMGLALDHAPGMIATCALLDGIDWRHPRKTWRPQVVG